MNTKKHTIVTVVLSTHIDPYTKEPYYLIVIHTAFNTHVKVITVMWVNSNGGLKARGFSNL